MTFTLTLDSDYKLGSSCINDLGQCCELIMNLFA